MDNQERYITYLKALRNADNANILEAIEKGFRHVMEASNYGNVYNATSGMHPGIQSSTTGVPAPADMITEDTEMDAEMDGGTSEEMDNDVPEMSDDNSPDPNASEPVDDTIGKMQA